MSGIFSNFEHLLNKPFISVTFFIFHFDKSGKDFNDVQPSNKKLIFLTLSKFHLDISGKEHKDEH